MRDRFVEIVDRSSHRGSGRTSLRSTIAISGVAADDRRLDEVAGPLEPLAAADDLAALRLWPCSSACSICFDGPLADQRAHQHAVFPRVADLDAAVGRDQPLHEIARRSTRARSAAAASCSAARRCRRRRRARPARPDRGRPTRVRITPLLPPSSSSERPSRLATAAPTRRPIAAAPGGRDQRQPAIAGHRARRRRGRRRCRG